MNTTMLYQDKEEMQPTGKDMSKQSSNSIYLASPKRRRFTYFQKISSLSEIERMYNNISIISSKYLHDYHSQAKVTEFKLKYKTQLQGSFIDIVLLIKEFSEFNLFDYISIFSKIKSKTEMRKMQQIRNNILLSILTVAKEASLMEKSNLDNRLIEKVFFDLSFLNPIVDELNSLIIESDTQNPYDLEIEVFFLSILDYKDKARMIKQKHNAYFKEFINSLNLPEKYTIDDLITTTILKDTYEQYTNSEMIVLRKIFSNAAKRKFYSGFELLLKFPPYNIVMSEGRIWKNIGQKLQYSQVYSLWTLYEVEIEQVRNTDLKPTIGIEYKNKLMKLSQTILQLNKRKELDRLQKNKLEFDRKELVKEISLYSVTCLKELLVIFFQYDLKELIMYIFDQYKSKKIPIEIYELCLDYDEDISIDIIDRALTQRTVKDTYMKIVLIKKYLRLAKCLLKFTVCKNYLNSPPPQNENYIFLMHKEQVKKRNEEFLHILFNKEAKNDGDKLIHFLQEEHNSSLQSICQNNSGSFQELLNNGNPIIINTSNNNNTNAQTSKNNSKNNVLKLKENQSYEVSSPDNKEKNNIVMKSNLLKSIEFLNEQKKKSYFTSDFDKGYSVLIKEPTIFKQDIDMDINLLSPVKKLSNQSILIKQKNKIEKDKARTALQFTKTGFKQNNDFQYIDAKDPSSLQSVYKSQINQTKTIEEIKLHQMKQINLPPLNVQSILIEELRYGQNAFDALCLLLSINDAYINLDYAE